MQEVARELLRLAEEQGDAAAQVVGHRARRGRLVPAREVGREPRPLRRLGSPSTTPMRDLNSALRLRLELARDLPALALPCAPHPRLPEPGTGAERRGDSPPLASSPIPTRWLRPSCCDCTLHQLLRDRREAQEQAVALIALATEHGFPLWSAAGVVVRGWALADGGQAEEGIAVIRRGMADYQATGAEMWSPYFLGLLAEAHGRAGQAAAGLHLVADALDRVERTGVRWIEAELHRLRGELLLALPEADQPEAEACFRRAVAVAREQDARLWELRAVTSLARLWRDQGEAGRSARPARPDLRLVHRGVRHAGSARTRRRCSTSSPDLGSITHLYPQPQEPVIAPRGPQVPPAPSARQRA